MPYSIRFKYMLCGQIKHIAGTIVNYKQRKDSIEVCGHHIPFTDILEGPTYCLRADIRDYINFRSIEMSALKGRVDPNIEEFHAVAKAHRVKLKEHFSNHHHPDEVEALVAYYDHWTRNNHTSSIKAIEQYAAEMKQNAKLIIMELRNQDNVERKRRVARHTQYGSRQPNRSR